MERRDLIFRMVAEIGTRTDLQLTVHGSDWYSMLRGTNGRCSAKIRLRCEKECRWRRAFLWWMTALARGEGSS